MAVKNHYTAVVQLEHFGSLFEILQQQGYRTIAPTVEDNAIVYSPLDSAGEMPVGIIEHQAGGSYRLEQTDRKTLFGYVVGPQSWKRYLNPPTRELFKVSRYKKGFEIEPQGEEDTPMAFIGVRSCELAAIKIQDKIFTEGEYKNTGYLTLRKDNFIVAVNCTRTGDHCFCVSMNTGPKVSEGFDLAVTEVISENEHFLLVESGSEHGNEVLEKMPHEKADQATIEKGRQAVDKAAQNMGRNLDRENLKEKLYSGFDSSHWEEIAKRCLTCGNCTMVCPTCFCTTTEDSASLGGDEACRICRWDSCYNLDFSYIYGGSIRSTEQSRYRQWLMHKLAYWPDQFGMLGCVGCGRCITWCPVGIDITEEAKAISK